MTKQQQVDALAKAVAQCTTGDAVVWFAYPKQSSKKYKSEIDRDHGWDVLGAAGFEPVRMVAIDEDWSAVRFRRVAFIKAMKRDPKYAMTASGKAKARAGTKVAARGAKAGQKPSPRSKSARKPAANSARARGK